MLVLSRRKNESILLGPLGNPWAVVTVVEIRAGGPVRLGIDAPPEVPVHRQEIAEQIAAQQIAAERIIAQGQRADGERQNEKGHSPRTAAAGARGERMGARTRAA